MEIFAWLQNVKEMKTREFTKLKVVFEGGALAALEAKERRVDQQIAVVERKHEELQVTLTCMESTKRDIEEYLAALERVEKGIATSDISLPAMEPQDLHMPTLEELMGNSLLPVPAVKPSDGVIEEASSTDDKKCEIKGLPFIVEFTAIERDQVRQREALIGSFKGMGVAKIRETFPTSTLDDSEKYYYGLLVERLHEGTFLENFKKAVVILGALRSGNEFCPRISRTVITGMKANTVKIALALGPETEAVSWALIQADILSAMNETLVFVRRIGVRGKFGRLNELTPLGQTASQVWTKDLLETDTLKLRQLAALHAYAQSRKD